MGVPEFTVDVFQNEYLPAGGCEVNAVLTATSASSAADGTAAEEVAHVALRVWTPPVALLRSTGWRRTSARC
jgi:hypothetical protein